MTVTTLFRGHEVELIGQRWWYRDTGESANIERPCIRCGRPPTPDGYDACQGHVLGAISVCCRHGVEDGYVMKEEFVPV